MSDRGVGFWSSKSSVEFYKNHRNKVGDLYKSEVYFLERSLESIGSVLDVGCAAGGFTQILRTYKENITYTGVDVSDAMITNAKRKFPADTFFVCDGKTLHFPSNSFDMVISFGVLHMTGNWKGLLMEAWRVCGSSLLFDLRVVEGEGISDINRSFQKLEFDGNWDALSRVPYIVVGKEELVDCLNSMDPPVTALEAFGYEHPVSKMTVSSFKSVCMTAFRLRKSGCPGKVEWNVPLEIVHNIGKAC